MQKKYFTKYLPVEGEIKEGDRYFRDGSLVIIAARKSDIEYCNNNPSIEKVKLFLCSRDIQVGDKYLEHTQINPDRYQEFVFTLDDKLDGFEPENSFKVIGEVSPEAIWVTEGMEFDEEELYYEGGFQGTIPDNYTEIGGKIKFRCPTCKTFH